MIQNEELLINRQLRNDLITEERLDVLDKVKELNCLPNTILSTVEQVANYYEVGNSAISSLIFDNKEEVELDGYRTYKGKEISQSDVISFKEFTQNRANYKFVLEDNSELSVGGKGIALFPKRAVLRIGMLLRDSKIAQEIRTMLLDNHFQLEKVHDDLVNGREIDIDKTSPTYFVDKEKQLREKELDISPRMTEAIMKGDMNEYLTISCEINAIKEEIISLQKEKEIINAPKIEGYDTFINTEDLLSWNTVAKNLNIGRNIMLKMLREHKILQTDEYEYKGKKYAGENHNLPYQAYMKYFNVKFSTYGNKKRATTKVKATGQDYIMKKLKEWQESVA